MSKRKPATNYLSVIDNLLAAMAEADVPRSAVAELVGLEYITLAKYLSKERNIIDPEVVKRCIVVTNLLIDMVARDFLPLPPETNVRLRKSIILERVDAFLESK